MSLQALSQRLSATTRWTHGRTEDDVLNEHERFFLLRVVIPAIVVHPLSDELNRRLGSECLFLGHIQVINELQKLVLAKRCKSLTSFFLKLGFELLLQ